MFLQTASHLGYINTTTLPPPSRVSPSQIAATPSQCPVLPQNTPFFVNPSSWPLSTVDPRDGRSRWRPPAFSLLLSPPSRPRTRGRRRLFPRPPPAAAARP